MKIFEITVNTEVIAKTSGGGTAYGKIKLDALSEKTLKILEKMFRESRIKERAGLEVLGEILFEAIFQGEVGERFKKELSSLEGDKIRIELIFGPAAEDLSKHMWEYLFTPDFEFLAEQQDLVINRFIPSSVFDRLDLPPVDELKILLVVSLPEKPGEELKDNVDIEKVTKEIEDYKKIAEEIKKLETNSSIKVKRVDSTRGALLAKEINIDYKPHIVHFIGYGEEYGRLTLRCGNDKENFCCKTFANLFKTAVKPRLVFLQLCQWPPETMQANFAIMAPELIKLGIPTVIATQYPISPAIALDFTQTFYNNLAEGKSIDRALAEGRNMISLSGTEACLVIGSPVLYMFSKQNTLLNPPDQKVKPGKLQQSETINSQETSPGDAKLTAEAGRLRTFQEPEPS